MRSALCILIMTFYASITAIPPSTHTPAVSVEISNIEHVRVHNKTKEIVNQEIQNVEGKQIIDEDETSFEYPVAKKEIEFENSDVDLHQLRQKCIHLTKLLNLNKNSRKPLNYEQYQEEYRPIYVTTQRPIIRTTYAPVTRPSSFYITAPPSNNRISVPAASAIRYIRLEPVILQKTILSNGRTVYYWHKSLPTSVEYPNKNEDIGRDDSYQGNYNYGYHPLYNYYYNPNFYIPPTGNYYQGVHPLKPTETTTEQSTTTTTEESSFSYGLSHLIPFYGSSSGDSTSTTTTESPTTTPPKPDDLIYAHKFKFVVPVPYDEALRQSWPYNPYNYNPQVIPQVPNNFRAPYGPQLQIVKVVPKIEAKVDDKDEEVTK